MRQSGNNSIYYVDIMGQIIKEDLNTFLQQFGSKDSCYPLQHHIIMVAQKFNLRGVWHSKNNQVIIVGEDGIVKLYRINGTIEF